MPVNFFSRLVLRGSRIYSFGLDLSGFRLTSFYIREKVLRICVSREGSQNMFFILGQHG